MAYRIALGADHGGVDLKQELAGVLKSKGHTVKDFGTNSKDSCDYPTFSFVTAEAVAHSSFDFGVLVCRSGIGMDICANKVPGIRAARCETVTQAKLSRAHNDANVLVLAADFINSETAKAVLQTFLETEFEGGRHQRRVQLINDYDGKHSTNR